MSEDTYVLLEIWCSISYDKLFSLFCPKSFLFSRLLYSSKKEKLYENGVFYITYYLVPSISFPKFVEICCTELELENVGPSHAL